jgi:hypothetical protein
MSATTFAFIVSNRKLFVGSPVASGASVVAQDGHHPLVYGAGFVELVTLLILYLSVIDGA